MSEEIQDESEVAVTPEMTADYSDNMKVREAVGLFNKAIELLPDKGYWTRCRAEMEDTLSYLQGRVKVLTAEMEVVEGEMAKAFDASYERMESLTRSHCERMSKLREKLKMAVDFEVPRLPWDAQEYIEFAAKIGEVPDKQLDKLIAMCGALKSAEAKGGDQ